MSKDKGLVFTPHPAFPVPSIELIQARGWDKDMDAFKQFHKQREDAIKAMIDDPYRSGHELDHWLKADKLLKVGSELMVLGGNRCLAPEQKIYDPVKQSYTPISELHHESYVLAWDGSRLVPAKASASFRKLKDRIYRVTLEDGASFSCSGAHRVLLANGGFRQIQDVSVGVSLHHPYSTSDIDDLAFHSNAPSWSGIPVDYSSRCFAYSHPSGERLHFSQEIDPNSFQLPDDAQVYTSCASFGLGDLGYKFPHNRLRLLSSLLSTQGVLRQIVAPFVDIGCYVSCKLYKSVSLISEGLKTMKARLLSFAESSPPRPIDESERLDNLFCSEMTFPQYDDNIRVVNIEYLRDDYVWDLTVPEYENYWCEGVIHHNSGKSEWAGKRVVQSALNNPNSIIWCFQTTFENSVQMQQKIIWKYIPKELKNAKRDKITNISYSQKRGFSDGKLVFPNGSEIVFRNYSQDISTIEGGEIGSMTPVSNIPHVHNIGFWADELIPQTWLDTLRYRLVTRDAVGIITFTPIEGYSPTVKEYLNGAKTEEDIEADLIKGLRVPIVQQPKRKDSKIIYYHTKDNPYGGYDRIVKTLEGAHRDDILCRAYGVPSKPMAGKFPKFSDRYNVVKHDEIPFIKDKKSDVTHYMVIDPSGAKPWFMSWFGVTPLGEIYLWAEFPDYSYGDWADMSKGTKGRQGDAAKPNGYLSLIHI